MIAAQLVARFPNGMTSLGILLHVEQQTTLQPPPQGSRVSGCGDTPRHAGRCSPQEIRCRRPGVACALWMDHDGGASSREILRFVGVWQAAAPVEGTVDKLC